MALKGDLVSTAAYTQMVPATTGQNFGPGNAQPVPDALLVTNTLTALTVTDTSGNTVTFGGTFPASGTILPLAAASVTFAPAAAIAALYR